MQIYTVSRKKETKMFSVISPTKLGQLWWSMAHSFLNKFAAMWCKHFPPHLNNVATLPCETWNAHRVRATIALLDRETPEFYSTSIVVSKFARFESSWLQSVRNIAREDVKIRITDLDELKQQLRTEWNKLDHVVIVAAIHQRRRR